MGKLDNIFKKIADAALTGGGNNIRDGIYKLAVEKCILNDEAHTGTCFIVEFRVLDSSANGALDEQGRPVVPNPVGSTCSMVCNVTKHESAYGNLKKFLAGALGGMGYTPDQITDVLIKQLFVDDPELLRGVQVVDETYRGINKGRANAANAGKPLTLNKWMTVEQTQEEILAMREYLTKNLPKVEASATTTAAPVGLPSTKPAAAADEAEAPPVKSSGLLASMKRP